LKQAGQRQLGTSPAHLWAGALIVSLLPLSLLPLLLLIGTPAARAHSRATQSAAHPGDEIIDEVGRKVKIPAEVRRIVTLSPDLTETVYALGLGDRLAGDTNFCDTPPEAKSKPHVGNPQDPSLEAIAGLHPDLVLASGSINRLETVEALNRLGIPVYTSFPHNVRGMLDSVSRMSDIMGAGAQGREVVAQLRGRLDALHVKLADRPFVHVLFVVWQQPLMTIGQNTFIADALRWAGAESIILSDRNYPQVSLEEVVRLQPEYLVFTSDHEVGGETGAADLADLRAHPVWRDLQAVELGHVVDVDEAIVRPSPGLVGAIDHLARQLHPEVFASAVGDATSTNVHAALIPSCAALMKQEAALCAR
jgi:iron complex transport system substrate-binding protein